MSIVVKIRGLDELEKRLGGSKSVFKKVMQKSLDLSAKDVQKYSRRKAPVDTARLKNSISYKVKNLTARIGPDVKYGVYVEGGTRAHFPPIGPLKSWARKRGINPYALQKAIGRRGTKAQPFMKPGLNKARKDIIQNFEKGIGFLIKYLAK